MSPTILIVVGILLLWLVINGKAAKMVAAATS